LEWVERREAVDAGEGARSRRERVRLEGEVDADEREERLESDPPRETASGAGGRVRTSMGLARARFMVGRRAALLDTPRSWSKQSSHTRASRTGLSGPA
jgi:hypothetical protein